MYLTTVKVYSLITYTTFVEAMAVLLSVASLLYLRYKQPKLDRPIKVKAGNRTPNLCLSNAYHFQVHIALPIGFFAVCLFLVLLPVYTKPLETGMGAFITLLGVPVYMVTVYWTNKPKAYRRIIGRAEVLRLIYVLILVLCNFTETFTQVIQIVFLSVPEEKND